MVQSCCSLNLQVRNTSQPLTPVPTPPYTRGPSHSSIVFQRRRTPSNGKMPRLWGGGCSIGPPPILKIHKNPLLWGVTCNLVWAQLWAEQASTLIAELQLPEGSATKRKLDLPPAPLAQVQAKKILRCSIGPGPKLRLGTKIHPRCPLLQPGWTIPRGNSDLRIAILSKTRNPKEPPKKN